MRGTLVTDAFTRTLASGWGSADTGQAWSTDGAGGTVAASDWSVGSGLGVHSVPVTNAYRMSYLATFSQPYADVAVTVKVNRSPIVGGPVEPANLITRGTSTTSYYLHRLQIAVGGALTATIFAPGGTQLATITVPGITYTGTSQLIRVRAQSIGRVHRMKVWDTSKAEPAAWVLSATDSTYLGAGFIGVRSGVATSNTNTQPIVFSYDDFASNLLPDFPRDKLPLTVLAAFGADLSADPSTWPWTNITAHVRANSVSVTPGRRDETSQAPTATCSFQLLNATRAYSANNPMSPNYPNVKRNTPVWVIVDPSTRFFGYANGFTPSWDTTGKVAIVSVSASGILRRLMQGKTPVKSPVLRATSSRVELRSYWGMEDSPGSATIASGIPGKPAMTFAGLNLAADATEPGSAPLPVFGTGGNLSASISGSFAGNWQVDWYYKITDPTPNEPKIMTVSTTDNMSASGCTWDVSVGGSFPTVITVRATNSIGTQLVNSAGTIGAGYFGPWVHARIMCRQNGGNVEWRLAIFPVGAPSGTFLTGMVAGTIGAPYNASVQANPALNGMVIGHLAAFDGYDLYSADQAQTGYRFETVTARLTRLCAEQGVPITIIGTSTVQMGPQSIDTFINLVRECEAADLGLLYDGFGPGLVYITRAARYNLPAALTLDVAAGQVAPPFAPVDDDQRNRNLYKVTRKGGSSATYEDKVGPLGTDPVKGIGVYDSTPPAPLNVAVDDVLPGYASWLVHMGTVEGFRYPSLNLDLAASPELIDDWVAARLNSRIDVLNVSGKATGHAPGTVSLLDEGYTETLGPKTWKIAANASRYDPWRVFVLGTDRLEADPSSRLVADITATATTFQVSTSATVPGALWTTDAAEWTAPKTFYINMDGEQMQVTAITGAATPQTFTVVRAVNGVSKTHKANAFVGLWQPRVLAL